MTTLLSQCPNHNLFGAGINYVFLLTGSRKEVWTAGSLSTFSVQVDVSRPPVSFSSWLHVCWSVYPRGCTLAPVTETYNQQNNHHHHHHPSSIIITESRPQLLGTAMSISDRLIAHWKCCSITYEIRTCRQFSWDWPIDRSPDAWNSWLREELAISHNSALWIPVLAICISDV